MRKTYLFVGLAFTLLSGGAVAQTLDAKDATNEELCIAMEVLLLQGENSIGGVSLSDIYQELDVREELCQPANYYRRAALSLRDNNWPQASVAGRAAEVFRAIGEGAARGAARERSKRELKNTVKEALDEKYFEKSLGL